MPTDRYPWYIIVAGRDSLEQGDLLDDYPIAALPYEIAEVTFSRDQRDIETKIDIDSFNVIIMTQSCDFQKLKDDDEVILCYRMSYPEVLKVKKEFATQDGWSKLRKGHFIGLHLLNACTVKGYSFRHQIVDLQRVFTSPLKIVKRMAEKCTKRVRLCPPYREHLAQSFARQFMRVGLPLDLPDKSPYYLPNTK